MKITGNQSYVQVGPTPKGMREIQGSEEKKNGIPTAPLTGDTVVLSPQARQLKEAREIYDTLPDVRADKVSQLREQITNGTYEMQSGRVAWKMLQESLLAERGQGWGPLFL